MNEDNVSVTTENGILHYEYEGDYSEFEDGVSSVEENPLEEDENAFDYDALTVYMDDSIDLHIQQNYLLVTIAFGIYLFVGILLAHVIWSRIFK